MKYQKWLLAGLVGFRVMLVSWTGWAGGYLLPDRGVRAFSRGGAFIVGCDDLSALWYNPALLAGQRGTRLHSDLALVNYEMDFQRYLVPEVGLHYPSVSNSAHPLPDPSLALSSDFGTQNFGFAAGVYAPYSGWSRFPEDGPQRYAQVRTENIAFVVEAAAAWKPMDGLKIGAGLAFFSFFLNDTHATSGFPGVFGQPEDTDLDGMIQLTGKDTFIPTVIAGLWFTPGPWVAALQGWELGFSLMPGVSVQAKGQARIRLPEHVYFDSVTVDPQVPGAMGSFDFPWVVRGGIRYRDPRDRFDIELNTVWEGWSAMKDIRLAPTQPTFYRDLPAMGDMEITESAMKRDFLNTWSVRLGGSIHPLTWLILRSGGYVETGASPDAYFTVATPDSDKWALSLGCGFLLGAFEIDLGYMHVFQASRDIPVTRSLVRQTIPNNPADATVIGGGSYESRYDLFGLSLLVHLDDLF